MPVSCELMRAKAPSVEALCATPFGSAVVPEV